MIGSAVDQYKQMQRLQTKTVLDARRAWGQVDAAHLSESWQAVVRASGLFAAVAAAQFRAAEAGAAYSAETLAAQGVYSAPTGFVNPSRFAGVAADGRPLESLLYSAVPYTKRLIGGGISSTVALASGRKFLDMLVKTTVADAGRGSAGADIAARPGVGYVRMLNPPSCSRCSVLAGKFYRWNAGFQRHPRCDCIHVASKDFDYMKAEGFIHDPYEYFNSLPESEQDKMYTAAGAQAIRDGADIFQVVNSRRGMKPGGLVTTEGTSRRGAFGRGRGQRLTPEAIYAQNLSREQTLHLLERNGYILPGGQDPLGVIRGQREGFGSLGRGGVRVGARDAVLEARRTGQRKPNDRYAMTEAERRLFDAQMRWDAVRSGRNPFSSRQPLTPQIAARVEKDFRRWLSAGGQVFVN